MVRYSNGKYLTDRNAKGSVCKHCSSEIFFYKSKKGKWIVLEPLGCGDDYEQVLTYHKCNTRSNPVVALQQ